jgi:poly [ADP-ribose] polymerase 6/8
MSEWKSDPSDDSEITIGLDESFDFTFAPEIIDTEFIPTSNSALQAIIGLYSAYVFDHPATLDGSTISFDLKRDFLPLSMQSLCGFTVSPFLLHVSFQIPNGNWHEPAKHITIRHPTLDQRYVGASLTVMTLHNFFSSSYSPKPTYRSQNHILMPTGLPNRTHLSNLISQGFDERNAHRALLICDNDITKAVDFLKTGTLPIRNSSIPIEYENCPLLYLVLELADVFLDIQDHCCMCRCPLPAGVKPLICDRQLCNFQWNEIGVGMSVIGEIKRDPIVADLLLSVFSAAVRTNFLIPAPPNFNPTEVQQLLKTIPSMNELISQCENDSV